MSDTFTAAAGRKIVSRTSAEELGTIGYLVVDVEARRVAQLVTGKGRKGRILDWSAVAAFGPDAVIVDEDAAVREPTSDEERAAVGGTFAVLGKRVLSEFGNLLGTLDDVRFDPDSGAVETLVVGGAEHPAASLLSRGSYAVILDRTADAA